MTKEELSALEKTVAKFQHLVLFEMENRQYANNQKMEDYLFAIDEINKNFKTNYMTSELRHVDPEKYDGHILKYLPLERM